MDQSPTRRWFVWLAPLTVPLYVLFLALMSLIGGSYYISIEMTLAPLLRRQVTLTGWRFWLASVPAVLLMPLAVAAHVVLWLLRQFGGWFATLGRWQTGLRAGWLVAPIGALWLAAAAWAALTCIDPQAGLTLIGRPIDADRQFAHAIRRRLPLREVLQRDPSAQRRYDRLIESLTTGVNRDDEFADLRLDELRDVDLPAGYLSGRMRAFIFGLPWYFHPAIQSDDEQDHCDFLIGPLLLALVLLPRWPGLHAGPWRRRLAPLFFLVRTGASIGAVVYALTWAPLDLSPPAHTTSALARALSPLAWMGYPPGYWLPPQWIPLNAAAWLILLGALAVLIRIARIMRPSLGAPGYYSAYLAVRLLQRKRIAFFSIGAVTLCVAMELIVISVMGGFLDTIRARSHGLMGDLVMDAGLAGFPFYDEFIAELRRRPDVHQATPVIYSYGVLRFPETSRTKAVEVRGIRLDEFRRVNDFGKKDALFYDTYYPGTTTFAPAGQPVHGVDPATEIAVLPPEFEQARRAYEASLAPEARRAFDDRWPRAPRTYYEGPGVFEAGPELQAGWLGRELPGIIIGRHIIAFRSESGEFERSTRYPRGMVVQLSLLPMTRRGQVSAESPPAPLFRYIDDSRTGVFEIDNRTVYLDFEQLQGILDMTPQKRAEGEGLTPARCTSMQIKLKPGVSILAAKRDISQLWDQFAARQQADLDDQAAMGNVLVSTCEELQRDFIAAIQKEKVLVVIMFGIISVVAVLLILCIFYMIVVEKTRDIGILKSVGGSAQGVAAVFLTYGAAIGIVGAALGSLIGALFVRHINEFQDWLARLNPEWRIWSPTTYSFDRIPDTVKLDEMLWIAGLAVLAAIIGAVLPAVRAARTWPVEALRYE